MSSTQTGDDERGERRRDLLQTLVVLGILATPGWLLPGGWATAWQVGMVLVGVPALVLSWGHAPWVPTPRVDRERLLAALALQPHERFCDLGAGDGRVVSWAQRHSGATCTGIEASPLLVALAWLRLVGNRRAHVRFADLYRADLSPFDAVYVWGTAYSVGTQRFAAVVQPVLARGGRVVAYGTGVAGWTPARVDRSGHRPLFVYEGEPMRGILVALEGIDGGGKSTQIRALAELLDAVGLSVVTTKEPTDGPHGQAIRRSAVQGRLGVKEELDLFEADRREHVTTVIGPALQAGQVVLVDRYYYSTAAYQGIRGVDPAEIVSHNETFAPRPDLLVVVDLPAEVGLQRVRGRDVQEDLFEALDDLKRCRAIFAANEGPHVLHVDGLQTPEAVTVQVLRALLTGPLQQRTTTDLEPLAQAPAPDDPAWRRQLTQALSHHE